MSTPVVDLFRFLRKPDKPFPYLGAMWVIETVQHDGHWECTTTVPLRLPLALAESEEALRKLMMDEGLAIVRNSKAWYLMQHLISTKWAEAVNPHPSQPTTSA